MLERPSVPVFFFMLSLPVTQNGGGPLGPGGPGGPGGPSGPPNMGPQQS